MPLAEIAVLIRVGGWLGLVPTLALIILTAVVGTWVLRRQGFAVLTRAQRQLEQGVMPVAEVFEGLCLLVAGALLLTPGFITDARGALLLLPPVRALLYRQVGHHLERQVVRAPARRRPGRQRPAARRRCWTASSRRSTSRGDRAAAARRLGPARDDPGAPRRIRNGTGTSRAPGSIPAFPIRR